MGQKQKCPRASADWNMGNLLNSSTTCEKFCLNFLSLVPDSQSLQIDSQFPLNVFSSEVRRRLFLTLKVYLSIDQRKSKGLFRVRVAASFTQWQERIPFLFTHTQPHLFLILSLSHTVQSPPVKRVLLAFCFTSYSAQCVCVCAAVWGSDRSRWRWVYNHETVIVVFIIILLLFLLLTENSKHNARVQRRCRKREVDSPHFCQMTHPKVLQSPGRSDGTTISSLNIFSVFQKVELSNSPPQMASHCCMKDKCSYTDAKHDNSNNNSRVCVPQSSLDHCYLSN